MMNINEWINNETAVEVNDDWCAACFVIEGKHTKFIHMQKVTSVALEKGFKLKVLQA